jgi:hypothetical protein
MTMTLSGVRITPDKEVNMPATSGKQYRFMAGIAHGMKPKTKSAGPSPELAEEFVKKTPVAKRKMWSKKGR